MRIPTMLPEDSPTTIVERLRYDWPMGCDPQILKEAARRIEFLEYLCKTMIDTGVLLEAQGEELTKADRWWISGEEFTYSSVKEALEDNDAPDLEPCELERSHTLENSYGVIFPAVKDGSGKILNARSADEFYSLGEAEDAIRSHRDRVEFFARRVM